MSFIPEENIILIDFNETNKKRKPSNGSNFTKEEFSQRRISILQSELIHYFKKEGYKSLTDLTTITRKLDMIQYICKCGEMKSKCFKKLLQNGCAKCNNILRNSPILNPREYIDNETGELWKETIYRKFWISSHGRIKHHERFIKRTCNIYLNKSYVSIPRLFYITFELPNYELLLCDDTKDGMVVSYKDNNSKNLNIENLYIRDRGDLGYANLNNKKSKN